MFYHPETADSVFGRVLEVPRDASSGGSSGEVVLETEVVQEVPREELQLFQIVQQSLQKCNLSDLQSMDNSTVNNTNITLSRDTAPLI